MAARRQHVAERRLLHDIAQRCNQIAFNRPGKTAQQHGALRHQLLRRTHIGNAGKQIGRQINSTHFAS